MPKVQSSGKGTRSSAVQGEPAKLCRQLALEVLALEDVAASLYHQPPIQHQVHGMLWHRAVACFQAGDAAASRALLSAALQLARPSDRPKNARMLAACHSKLGEQRRALEYLAIAARHEQQPSCLTLLYRLDALAQLGQSAEAMAGAWEAQGRGHPGLHRCCGLFFEGHHSALASQLPIGPKNVYVRLRPAVLLCSDKEPGGLPGLPPLLPQGRLSGRQLVLQRDAGQGGERTGAQDAAGQA